MGRKGVSKRKPVKTKNKPLSSSPASGTVASIQGSEKPATEWKKNTRKD